MSGQTSWLCSPDGTVHLPLLEGPGLVTVVCRSLPSGVPQDGPAPSGRRCPVCFAALIFGSPVPVNPGVRSRS